MMIIVEGPDGSGKSTLVELIRQKSHRFFWILRPSGPPKSRQDILRTLHWLRLRQGELSVLLDRHPAISEPIYGPRLRGLNKLKDFDSQEGRLALLQGTSAIVYCRPALPVIVANCLNSYQLDGVRENIEDIVEAYDNMMCELSTSFRVLKYDYNEHDAEQLVRRIWNGSRDTRIDLQSPEGTGREVPSDRDPEPWVDPCDPD